MKLNELTMNAFNMELSATERSANTIDYASNDECSRRENCKKFERN